MVAHMEELNITKNVNSGIKVILKDIFFFQIKNMLYLSALCNDTTESSPYLLESPANTVCSSIFWMPPQLALEQGCVCP